MRTTFCLLLIAILFFSNCNPKGSQEISDPVSKSLDFQSWEKTQKPVGTPAYLGLGTYAKVLCTAVFESGRTAEEAFQNSGKLILDQSYHDAVNFQIDYEAKQTILTMGDSLKRTATYHGDQGCIIDSSKGLQFEPVQVVSALPDAETIDWPMGDVTEDHSDQYDQKILQQAKEAAFDSRALTAAFLVVHKGNIILEHYDQGVNKNTQLESWSMGKSLTGTLIGRLMHMGKLSLDQKAPVEEWQKEGDPRREITIKNLMQMSSGLRFPAHRDPEVKVAIAQLEHMYVYTEAINIFDFVVNRPLEFVPGTAGRYRNCDPLTLGYIFRKSVEADGQNYWTWPQEELFDKIGIRRQLMETDPYGNFILSGFDYGTARNWARLGMLYLQDGMWQGERLLPEGFVDFVSTPAESWEAPVYGGMFWVNGNQVFSLPKEAYYMAGGGGQRTIIVPSMDLVVVRMGHSQGGSFVGGSLNSALRYVVGAIEQR